MQTNSALEWLPLLYHAHKFPIPPTIFIKYDHLDLVSFLEDGDTPKSLQGTVKGITDACEKIGYPCFFRTDRSSAKHSGPTAYKITGPEDVERCLLETVEDNEMKFFMSPDEMPLALMIRKFVELDATFVAFGGLPIAREWRFFADEDKVKCFHPYWPAEAFDHQNLTPENWADLCKMWKEPSNLAELKTMAMEASEAVGGFNSVDFAQGKDGKWWLFDMAKAENSYHWSPCPVNDVTHIHVEMEKS